MTPTQAIAVLRSIPTHDAMQAEAVEMAVAGLLDAQRWEKIEQLWFLGEVELTTDENGHFLIYVDPAEHKSQTWIGIDQSAAIDAVFALDNLRAAVEPSR